MALCMRPAWHMSAIHGGGHPGSKSCPQLSQGLLAMGGADGRVQGCISRISVSVGGSGPPPSPWFHILLGLHSPAFSEGAHCPGGGLEGRARPSFSMQMPSAMQVLVAQSVSRALGPPSWTTSCLVGLGCSEGGGLRNLTNHSDVTWACLLSRQLGWPVFLASKG